jgi:hypothetical protein
MKSEKGGGNFFASSGKSVMKMGSIGLGAVIEAIASD